VFDLAAVAAGPGRGGATALDPAGPVIGIDPGLTRCGYGAVRREAGTLVAVTHGVIVTDPATPLAERLEALERDVATLLATLRPSAVAVERLLFQHNVRTAMAVGQASGVVLACTARVGVPVTHYSPNEVKLAVTGSGTADKSQVQVMVTRLLHLAEPPTPFDAADALALALCHAWGASLRTRTAAVPPRANPRLARAVERAISREAAS
jgi:crossover junction endodeoxyribonuclease RuvC